MSIVSLCRLRCCIFQLKRCQSINTWSFPSFMLHIRNWTKLRLSQLLFLNPILFRSVFLAQLRFYTTIGNLIVPIYPVTKIVVIFHCLSKSLKVSKSQNKFMKSSFLPKNDDFTNLFWDLLTFRTTLLTDQKFQCIFSYIGLICCDKISFFTAF